MNFMNVLTNQTEAMHQVHELFSKLKGNLETRLSTILDDITVLGGGYFDLSSEGDVPFGPNDRYP